MRRLVFLVAGGLLLGAALTAGAGALPGSQDLTALSWLGTVATVAALVVAVGIYRVQQVQSDAAHQELLDALKAQDQILQDLAEATPPSQSGGAAAPRPEDDPLTPEQRQAVEARYGDRSIDAAWKLGRGGRGNRARMVRLDDGTLVSVFDRGRGDGIQVHEIDPRRRAVRERQAGARRGR